MKARLARTLGLESNMLDSSSLVPWVTALLGCAGSYGIAKLTPREISFFSVLLAGAKSFGLSLASFFVGSLLHGLCIEVLQRCTTHGDGNITYAMGGVLAFPIYWLIIVLFGTVTEVESARTITTQCEAACSVALIKHVEGESDATLCPACHQVISTRRYETKDSDAQVVTRCSCGKCNSRLEVRPSEA